MENLPRPLALRYSVPALTVGLALLLTLEVGSLAERTPFALFFAAVVISTWYGGRNPGLLAIALSVLVSNYFVIRPLHSPLLDQDNILRVSTFILLTLLVTSLTFARQRSEKSLRESEERYRLLFERNPLPMWVYDMETLAFLAVNKAAMRCYGYSKKEFLSMTIKDICLTEDISALLDSAAGNPCRLDVAGIWRHRKKDGTVIDVEITSHPLIFAGRHAGIVLANDITERKQAEEALHDSQARLAGIVDSAMDAIITVDKEQRILLFNRAAEQMFRCPAEEAIGQPLDRFIPQRFRANHHSHIRDFGRTNVTKRAMGSMDAIFGMRADGEEFPIEASISQLESEGQKFFTVILRDITERKRTEEALRASEARFSIAFNASPISSVIATLDEGRYVAVNDTYLSLTGFKREEVIGHTSADLGIWLTPEARAEAIELLLSQGHIRNRETRYRMKTGEVRIFLMSAEIIELDGQPHLITASIDITERKRAEEELAAITQQFWQASRLAVMGELAASIAHELNNPLATVALRAESLLAQVAEDDPQRRPLEVIDQEVERMGGLVGNLLQFSRRNHKQISTLDVREEIANTLEFIHYHLRKHQINVEHEFADTIPTVQADRQQLRQLFLNLLTNASDAMPKGGTLTVRAVAGQMESGAGAVVIEFADTGVGIAPDDLAKIWEPFFTTKSEGKGTGLGLAICRRIVEEHGGTTQIESGVGQGTTVRIILPATNGEKL